MTTPELIDFAGVLKELKGFGLLGRVAVLEVNTMGVKVEFGPPAGDKPNPAKEALERAATDEEIMYGSAG